MSVSQQSVHLPAFPGDPVVEGPYTWPDLILLYYSGAIWKVKKIKPFGRPAMDPCDYHSDLIDIETFGAVWAHGGPFTFEAKMQWISPTMAKPLNDMQIIALAALDEFPFERVMER